MHSGAALVSNQPALMAAACRSYRLINRCKMCPCTRRRRAHGRGCWRGCFLWAEIRPIVPESLGALRKGSCWEVRWARGFPTFVFRKNLGKWRSQSARLQPVTMNQPNCPLSSSACRTLCPSTRISRTSTPEICTCGSGTTGTGPSAACPGPKWTWCSECPPTTTGLLSEEQKKSKKQSFCVLWEGLKGGHEDGVGSSGRSG